MQLIQNLIMGQTESSESVEFDVDDERTNYAKSTKNRLTMRYDMHVLKRVGEIEDSFREKLGLMLNCDPDELPVDFDLTEVQSAGLEEGRNILVRLPSKAVLAINSLYCR